VLEQAIFLSRQLSGQAIYHSGAGCCLAELLHKCRDQQGGMQTHFSRFLLRQPKEDDCYLIDFHVFG
jgi:hypothetical protein